MESRKNSLHRYYYMASELLLLPGFEKEIQGLTDAAQTKLLNGNILQGHPKAFGRIVGCQRLGIGRHLTAEEEIEGVDIHARIQINIGEAEQIVGTGDLQSRLLLHLAHHSLPGCLTRIGETSGQVERSLGWLLTPALHQQFATTIDNEGCGGRTGIHEILKTTILAFLAFLG